VKLLRNRDVVCRQAVELMTDYLEGRLSRGERRRFEAHLVKCPHCTEYLAQLRETIRLTGQTAARSAAPEDLPPQLRDELIQLYRRWQSEQ
jgi:anti-sigma factor RsiW